MVEAAVDDRLLLLDKGDDRLTRGKELGKGRRPLLALLVLLLLLRRLLAPALWLRTVGV
jgi:hypothetical protein